MSSSLEGHKRSRTAAVASRVLHVKGFTSITREELATLCGRFGTVEEVVILDKGTSPQAFVQMNSISDSQKVLEYYQANPQQAFVSGGQCQFEYSRRDRVSVPTPRADNPAAGATLAASGSVNSILLVSVQNMRHPVTIENLWTVFSRFGQVARIVTFTKVHFQAFVEFVHVASAVSASREINGKDLFTGCNTLRIAFASQSPPLKVKANDERSWDFIAALPPWAGGAPAGGAALYGHFPQRGVQGSPAAASTPAGVPQGGVGSVLLVSNLPVPAGALPPSASEGAPAEQVQANPHMPQDDKLTCDSLFTLFGLYGNVMRVKIFFNRPDKAMVQFNTPMAAALAHQHVHKMELFGQPLAVSISKHSEVKLPPAAGASAGSDEAEKARELTKDFSHSKLHRFRVAGGKNEKNICPPNNVLHVSNVPEGISTADLQRLLSAEGKLPITAVEPLARDPRMAYVTCPTISDAVRVLLRFHNHRLGERYLRISFATRGAGSGAGGRTSGGASPASPAPVSVATSGAAAPVAPAEDAKRAFGYGSGL